MNVKALNVHTVNKMQRCFWTNCGNNIMQSINFYHNSKFSKLWERL